MDINNVFGCSMRRTILLKEGFFLFFRMFTSLEEREKKATSLPAIKKESKKSKANKKNRTVEATGDTVKKKRGKVSNTE
jgi:hypothetical protein